MTRPRRKDHLPSELRIGHLIYTVRRKQKHLDRISARDGRPNLAGFSEAAKQRITLSEHLSHEYEVETLIHEILHSCFRVTGTDPDADAKANLQDVEERAVTSLAGPLAALLRDNPGLVRYILGDELADLTRDGLI